MVRFGRWGGFCRSLFVAARYIHSSQDIETRIAALEKGAAFDATQEAVREREEEFLATLREIKAGVQKDEETKGTASAASDELAALKEENARLEAKAKKQDYRIGHLVASMETLLAAASKREE